jgi:2-amino-4-hydroxy-6-hydroxymethyldihydropteridine diphosphokinase
MARVFVGIGSNVGDREGYIELARRGLAAIPRTRLVAMSPVYETEPVGPVPQGSFLNAAAELETDLEPFELLRAMREVERAAGREPPDQRMKWGPRTLDLDILLYGERVLSHDDLVVPHPLMHERWFVLKPLADLDPSVVHPLLEMTVGDLLEYLEQPPDNP